MYIAFKLECALRYQIVEILLQMIYDSERYCYIVCTINQAVHKHKDFVREVVGRVMVQHSMHCIHNGFEVISIGKKNVLHKHN